MSKVRRTKSARKPHPLQRSNRRSRKTTSAPKIKQAVAETTSALKVKPAVAETTSAPKVTQAAAETTSAPKVKQVVAETTSAPKIKQAVAGNLSIFLSYKDIDDKDHALGIKERLANIATNRVTVFVAADVRGNPPGGKWRERIAAQLRNSDVLILLYSNPKQNFGWSLYESGYFDCVKSNHDNPTDLIVLLGPNVERPGPLADWQPIVSDPEDPTAKGVKALLERLYVDTEIHKGVLADHGVVKLATEVLTAPFSVPPILDAPAETFIKSGSSGKRVGDFEAF